MRFTVLDSIEDPDIYNHGTSATHVTTKGPDDKQKKGIIFSA